MTGDSPPAARYRRALTLIAGCLLSVIGVAVLNRAASAFAIADGVAIVFPASAVTVVASVLLGWPGVLASFVGYAISPWGLSTNVTRGLLFAVIAAVQGAVPVLAGLQPERRAMRRALRILLVGCVLNTLASAVLATPAIALFAASRQSYSQLGEAFLSWWLGDMTAVVLLGLPVLLLLRPALLLGEVGLEMLQTWARRPSQLVAFAVLIATEVAAMVLLGGAGLFNLHWLALLLLAPVLAAAATGGLGAGLLVNAIVGVVYVTAVLRLVAPTDHEAMFRELLSSYLNLGVFAVAAVVAGLYAARSRGLLLELDRHRHLLQESFERVVTALAAAIEAKDPTTQGHVQRVARLAVRVGRRLELDDARMELLRYAAILHDVGKIGVPESVLNKKGELTDEERGMMERHVAVGVEILDSIDILRPAVPFIRYHQERWDGRTDARYPGYHGLGGEEIPLEARIIATVDAYDAMTHDRPYREAMAHPSAVAELRAEAGRQFDPRVVEALLEVVTGSAGETSSGRHAALGSEAPDWITG